MEEKERAQYSEPLIEHFLPLLAWHVVIQCASELTGTKIKVFDSRCSKPKQMLYVIRILEMTEEGK